MELKSKVLWRFWVFNIFIFLLNIFSTKSMLWYIYSTRNIEMMSPLYSSILIYVEDFQFVYAWKFSFSLKQLLHYFLQEIMQRYLYFPFWFKIAFVDWFRMDLQIKLVYCGTFDYVWLIMHWVIVSYIRQ